MSAAAASLQRTQTLVDPVINIIGTKDNKQELNLSILVKALNLLHLSYNYCNQ